MSNVTMESTVGTRVLIHLQPEAYEALDVQGIDDLQFVARVQGFDTFGLWIENPTYCTTPVYSDEGEYIAPEDRGEVCHRAIVLLQWGYIQTILQFPDRPTYGATLNANEIGFKLPLPPEGKPVKAGRRRAAAPAVPKAAKAKPQAPAAPAKPKAPAKPVAAAKTVKTKGAKRG